MWSTFYTFMRGVWRLARYRLYIPLKRNAKTPRHIARGVMVGTVWAFTPVMGIQMLGAYGTWLASRRFFKWDFSLPNALAWTWLTNALTIIPCYYLFYVTGQLMLGRLSERDEADDVFDAVVGYIDTTEARGPLHMFAARLEHLLNNVGLPMAIGWIPWAILFGWLAYTASLSFMTARHNRLRRKREARHKRA